MTYGSDDVERAVSDTSRFGPPAGGRAPGWTAGLVNAARNAEHRGDSA